MHVEMIIFHICWVKENTFSFISFHFNVAPRNIWLRMCHIFYFYPVALIETQPRVCKATPPSHPISGVFQHGDGLSHALNSDDAIRPDECREGL